MDMTEVVVVVVTSVTVEVSVTVVRMVDVGALTFNSLVRTVVKALVTVATGRGAVAVERTVVLHP